MTTREIVLEGGSPWGFRIHGGVDTKSPLRIARVNSSGKAAFGGIREGDIISSINGHSTKSLTCSEAHALIKNSNDSLKLELTEDTGTTRQRKRNRATIHETHSETVKNTSSSLYSRTSSKTIFNDEHNEYNEPEQLFRKQPSIEGKNHHREQPDPPISPNSTASSDVSSCSTLTEAGTTDHPVTKNAQTSLSEVDMPDRANSKSKKKRSKCQKNKLKKAQDNVKVVVEIETIKTENDSHESSKSEKVSANENYSVDFSETVTSSTKLKTKSKSLDDDDDAVKIQEVTGSFDEEKHECEAIISEADSDWEETSDLRVPQNPVSLSTVAISIDEEPLQRAESLSPEEELSLRNFLEGIHLVNAPDPQPTSSSTSTLDTIKKEKARKQNALAKYFTPLVYNPRYLDIISEEGSDVSDRETTSLTHHLKQGTPELEFPPKIPKELSPRLPRKNRLNRKLQSGTPNKAVLVCTKIVDTPSIIEHFHTNRSSENIEAEKVFLENSSDSTSSKTSSDSEENVSNEKDSKGTPEIYQNYNITKDDVREVIESQVVSECLRNDISFNSKTFDFDTTTTIAPTDELVERDTKNDITLLFSDKPVPYQSQYNELTPPPTPDSSPKNKLSANSSIDLEECMKEIATDTAREISSVLCKLSENNNYGPTFLVDRVEVPCVEQPTTQTITSRSPSRSSSSSRGTSPSTVRFNPMNSSIADVLSILPDLELAKEALSFKQPLSLRQLCLNFLLSLPCGAEILQELSDISFNLDRLTQAVNLTKNMLESDEAVRVPSDIENNKNESISEVTEESNKTMWADEWEGLPFQNNPKLLLYLSPTQKHHLDKSKAIENGPEVLFDLHTKFMDRKDSNECKTHFRRSFEITSIQKENVERRSDTSYSITRTLPRNFKPASTNPRLDASSLNEWLKIARHDSSSQQFDTNMAQERGHNDVKHCDAENTKRRVSLPDDIYKRQMQYILQKEKEIEKELQQLLDEKNRLQLEMRDSELREEFVVSSDQNEKPRPKSFPPAPSETFRQQMYEEYMKQVAEREDRKQHKVIKITSSPGSKNVENEKPKLEAIHITGIEDEFMKKVEELHGPLDKVEEEEEIKTREVKESESTELEPVLLMDGNSLKEATDLPKHLKEFVEITNDSSKAVDPPNSSNGVWSPGQKQEFSHSDIKGHQRTEKNDEAIPTFWQPKSAASSPVAERKEFRPISFESPILSRRNKSEEVLNTSEKPTSKPPWQGPVSGSDTGVHLSATLERRLPNSRSTPSAGFNEYSTPRLPRAQNPTITLLQKAREGQLPRGANYLEANRDHYRIPHDSGRQREIIQPRRTDYYSESDSEIPRSVVNSSRTKLEGVGPITREGMPLSLRSEVKDSNQSKWYKKMYDTIHKQKPYKDEYVTVRYKQRRAQYPYITGYLSEPEPGAYDSDQMDYKYATLDRRRTPLSEKGNQFSTSTMPRSAPLKTSSSSDILHNSLGSKLNPGRIENYTPGHSSISDQESKRWWDEVMDIFDGWMDDIDDYQSFDTIPSLIPNFEEEKKPISKGYMSQALKESGYESDSTLIFRRKEDGSLLSPSEQKEAYKIIQKGGDIPLHGLRKSAPERPKETSFRPVSPSYAEPMLPNNIIPQQQIFCYPVTVHPKKKDVFADFKRSAPTSVPTTRSSTPPSPPRRRSSRNNTTLRLITTMKVGKEKLPICKRHEICFTSKSDIEKSKVKYLRDKISCKLSPSKTKKSSSNSASSPISKTGATSPGSKTSILTKATVSSSKSPKTPKTEPCCSKDIKSCKTCASRAETRAPKKMASKSVGTFGTEKRKILMNLPKFFEEKKIAKSPVTSRSETSPMSSKESKTVPSSPNVSRKANSLNIKVNISEEGKRFFNIARTPSPTYSLKPNMRFKTSSPSLHDKTSTIESSWESLKSPTLVRKERMMKNIPIMKKIVRSPSHSPSREDLKKAKKEEINVKIAGKKNTAKSKGSKRSENTKSKSEGGRKQIGAKEIDPTFALNEIQRRHRAVHSDHFFQHLFLGDQVSPPSIVKKNSSLFERTFQRTHKDTTVEHNARAMKIYLNHTKPVTDSKFRCVDIRSRSVSPKSLTFEKNYDSNDSIDKCHRSISLPPKLLYFSQTSRPVSPVVQKRFLEIYRPPESPTISRSPSQRRIDAMKQTYHPCSYSEEYTSCYPSLLSKCNTLTRAGPNQQLNQEITRFARKSTKFKDLNEFYLTLEKLGELERIANNNGSRIRKRSEGEIVDFDRWKEVHQKERAEKEINYLCGKLKEKQKDEGFLFRPKDVKNYKWNRELDRGLRVREKSVENIKEDFEKLKLYDPSHMEKIVSARDTYKPLWRGSSVLNLANHMVARRSQSEGRVPHGYKKFSSSDKLLTKGIGSRIWSSLSMDQVNTLKEQLTEIYNPNSATQKGPPEFSVFVPVKHKSPPTALTVRRNSDVSNPSTVYRESNQISSSVNVLSETDKKRISQSLSKEVMNRISKSIPPSTVISSKESTNSELEDAMRSNANRIKKSIKFKGFKQRGNDISGIGKEISRIKQIPKVKDTEVDGHMSGSDTSKEGKIKSSESGSTDESTKTVIFVEKKEDIRKKVDYFEKGLDNEEYIPTIYKPSDIDVDEEKHGTEPGKLGSSNSCQDFKELFGETELVRMASRPLSATRKSNYTSPPLQLRTTNLSPCKLSISGTTSCDSLYRSRSLSPFFDEPETLIRSGEVRRLKDKFEFVRSYYSNGLSLKPRRCFSDSNLYKKSSTYLPALTNVDVDSLRRRYEYPVRAGRGRSRVRRGGVVSPVFLRAEDRFMPHINIISKIATLCSRKYDKSYSPTNEDLSEILNYKSGDVDKLKHKFDTSRSDISLLGKMFTSSPNIKELRDIAPYLTASWTAHRFPRSTENTISLISPNESVPSIDTSLVRKTPSKAASPKHISNKTSILKSHQRPRSAELPSKAKYEANSSRASSSSQLDLDDVRYSEIIFKLHYRIGDFDSLAELTNQNIIGEKWKFRNAMFTIEPEPPVPPPKGHHAPRESQQGSPRKYVENQVTIHYKTPVRQEIKEYYSEDELAHRQQEAMKKIYQEERRRKYLQELQDMHNRRHTDNFIPSQKSPIALNRYDDFDDLVAPQHKIRPRSPEPRLVARALYNFVGMTPRELTFRKGDNIYVRRQIDKNWYEGELNAMVGLFPVNYVEIIPYENVRTTPRKPHEGQARAKYNFLAKTHLELSLAKGEMVIITRRVDNNWYEGKIGGRRGIFPASYVDVLIDPQEAVKESPKPVAAPAAHSLLLNGSSARESMGSHTYAPNLSNPDPAAAPSYFAKPIQVNYCNNYGNRNSAESRNSISQALHIDTQSADPTPFKALYKYLPQNDDELELMEGDTVYVLEKCDDGWYVGSNERTGAFGTFPGNYVDKA